MRRIVERELARSRQRHRQQAQSTALRTTVEAIARTLARTPAGEAIAWDVDMEVGLAATADIDDLNEVFGNLMENAARVAASRVRVRVTVDGEDVLIAVADDGPAVDPQSIARLITRGARLDESGGSAGLGLAIVADILEAHASALHFATLLDSGRPGSLVPAASRDRPAYFPLRELTSRCELRCCRGQPPASNHAL